MTTMRTVGASTALLGLTFALGQGRVDAAASPSPSPAPLRHLVFSVKVAVTRSGVPTALEDRGGSTPIMQSALTSKGTITCNVVAFDASGDLVVDVSEDAPDRVTPVRRVVLHPDGSAAYAASAKALNQEEAALLRLLARGTIGSATRKPSDSWVLQNTAGSDTTTATYRVTAVRAPDEIVVAIDEDDVDSGALPFTGKTHATVVYDPTRTVPRSARIDATITIRQGSEGQILRYEIDVSRLEDSFVK